MDFKMKPYIVYIKPDAQNRIGDVNSSAFLTDVDGWREIDSGFGDKYHHAQGNYFSKPLYDERGIKRYMTELLPDDDFDREMIGLYEFEGEQWGIYERTQEEMDADYIPPVPVPDPTERIAALEAAMTAIEEGIASV